MSASAAAKCTSLLNVKKKKFTNLRLVAINVSNSVANLPWHFSSRTSQEYLIVFATTFIKIHRLTKCLRLTTLTIYMHIVTCGRTVGAQSRQLSCLRSVLLSPFSFGLLIVRQPRQATHTTNVTDHHNIHQAASDPANITSIQYFTSLQTTLLSHTIRMGPSEHNILGSHCAANCTLQTHHTTRH